MDLPHLCYLQIVDNNKFANGKNYSCMLNPRTKDAVEILNGLVRINSDRIKFYQNYLEYDNALDPEYREFFALVAGESYQNNIWISIEIQTIEGNIDADTPVDPIRENTKPTTPLPDQS